MKHHVIFSCCCDLFPGRQVRAKETWNHLHQWAIGNRWRQNKADDWTKREIEEAIVTHTHTHRNESTSTGNRLKCFPWRLHDKTRHDDMQPRLFCPFPAGIEVIKPARSMPTLNVSKVSEQISSQMTQLLSVTWLITRPVVSGVTPNISKTKVTLTDFKTRPGYSSNSVRLNRRTVALWAKC